MHSIMVKNQLNLITFFITLGQGHIYREIWGIDSLDLFLNIAIRINKWISIPTNYSVLNNILMLLFSLLIC